MSTEFMYLFMMAGYVSIDFWNTFNFWDAHKKYL